MKKNYRHQSLRVISPLSLLPFHLLVFFSLLFISCEKDLPLYDDPQGRLDFYYTSSNDSLLNYSFNYHHGVERDTIWLDVRTSGFVSDKDRYFELEQVPSGTSDAIADKHYVGFDNTDYQQLLRIPAGQVRVQVPIIVLKDASLDEQDAVLKIAIKDNGTFTAGNMESRYKIITISNRLTQPSLWSTLMLFYFGHWGPVKHQFMIDNSDALWDDDYLKSLGVDNISTCDQAYLGFLRDKLATALYMENMNRMRNGESWLTDSDGTIIQFTNELFGY